MIVPEGTFESSPAFQTPGSIRDANPHPVGMLEPFPIIRRMAAECRSVQASLQDAVSMVAVVPASETGGLFVSRPSGTLVNTLAGPSFSVLEFQGAFPA